MTRKILVILTTVVFALLVVVQPANAASVDASTGCPIGNELVGDVCSPIEGVGWVEAPESLQPTGETPGGVDEGDCSGLSGMRSRVCEVSGSATMVVDLIEQHLSSPALSISSMTQPSWYGPYGVSFAIGLVIMTVVLMMGLAKAADGTKISGWQYLSGLGVKAWFFVPVMAVLPSVVISLSELSTSMAQALAGSAKAEALSALDTMFSTPRRMAVAGGAFFGMGAGLSLLIPLILALVFAFGILVEIVIAQFATVLVTVLMPMGIALSIHPSHRQVGSRLIAGLIGVLLIIPTAWFVLWVGGSVVTMSAAKATDTKSLIMMLLTTVVLLAAASSVPALAPMALSKLIGAGAESMWDRTPTSKASSVMTGVGMQAGWRATDKLMRGGSSAGGSASSAGRTAAASASKTSMASTTSAASGAGSVAAAPTAAAFAAKAAVTAPKQFKGHVDGVSGSVDQVASPSTNAHTQRTPGGSSTTVAAAGSGGSVPAREWRQAPRVDTDSSTSTTSTYQPREDPPERSI